MKVKDLIELVNERFPLNLALSWDNVGLQVGDPEWNVEKTLIALDISEEIIEEAEELKAKCIVTHHPLFLKNTVSINLSQRLGRIVYKLLKNHIALVSFHTNVDIASGGLADYVALKLGLQELKALTDEGLGRVGILPEEREPKAFVEIVRKSLKAKNIKVMYAEKKIKRVAVCPGSGGDLIRTAASMADCFVTGDIKYHQAKEIEGIITVIDAGHYYTEYPFCELMREVLTPFVEVFISKRQKEPFIFQGGIDE